MTVICLMKYAICLSCFVFPLGVAVDELLIRKSTEKELPILKNLHENNRKWSFEHKLQKDKQMHIFPKNEQILAKYKHNDIQKKLEENFNLLSTKNLKSRVKRTARIEEIQESNNYFPLKSKSKDFKEITPNSIKKSDNVNQRKITYKKHFKFLEPFYPNSDKQSAKYQNIIPNLNALEEVDDSENLTIFSFIDKNGHLNFKNNFTANLLKAIQHGENKELLRNISKIASETMKPTLEDSKKWSSDWFEVSLKSQPNSDAKIKAFNKLLGYQNPDSPTSFLHNPTNSNYSIIHILRTMMQKNRDMGVNQGNNATDTRNPSDQNNAISENLNKSNPRKNYNNGEILNYIVDKIKKTSSDVSREIVDRSNVGLKSPTVPGTLHQSTANVHSDSQDAYNHYIQSQISLNLNNAIDFKPFSSKSSDTNGYAQIERTSQVWSHLTNPSLTRTLDTLPPQKAGIDLLNSPLVYTVQTHLTKVHSNDFDSMNQHFLKPVFPEKSFYFKPKPLEEYSLIGQSKINTLSLDKIDDTSTSKHENTQLAEDISQFATQYVLSATTESSIPQTKNPIKMGNDALNPEIPSYFQLSQGKMRQLKHIVSESLSNLVFEKYNFPKIDRYKIENNSEQSIFIGNVKNWAGNLTETLLKDSERIANTSAVLLKAKFPNEIESYLTEMTEEALQRGSKRIPEEMVLEKVLGQLNNDVNSDYYSQSDLESINKFIKIVLKSNYELKIAIDQSFQTFVIKSEEAALKGYTEDRQMLISSMYTSSQFQTSAKNETVVVHTILPDSIKLLINQPNKMNLSNQENVHIQASFLNSETSQSYTIRKPTCHDQISGSSCSANYHSPLNIKPTTTKDHLNMGFSEMKTTHYFTPSLLTLQQPESENSNVFAERFSTNMDPLSPDSMSISTKLLFSTKTFYSNNLITSAVVTKTLKTLVSVPQSSLQSQSHINSDSSSKKFQSLKSSHAGMSNVSKQFASSKPTYSLIFASSSKPHSPFTIDVTRVPTDTKYVNILTNSFLSVYGTKSSEIIKSKNKNTDTLIRPSSMVHAQLMSTVLTATNHPTHHQFHDLGQIVSLFINKLLLLQLLLLLACRKTPALTYGADKNASNQHQGGTKHPLNFVALSNILTPKDDEKPITESIDADGFFLNNSLSDLSNLIGDNMMSLIHTKNVPNDVISNLSKLQNSMMPIKELLEKTNLLQDNSNGSSGIEHNGNGANSTGASNSNNLVVMLQNAVDVMVKHNAVNDTNVIKEEIKELTKEINGLREQILDDMTHLPPVLQTIPSSPPSLESSFTNGLETLQSPVSSAVTPHMELTLHSTESENSHPNMLTSFYSKSQLTSPSLTSDLLVTEAMNTSSNSHSIIPFTLDNEMELFLKEIMDYTKHAHDGNPPRSSTPYDHSNRSPSLVTHPSHHSHNYEVYVASSASSVPYVSRHDVTTSTITIYQNLNDVNEPYVNPTPQITTFTESLTLQTANFASELHHSAAHGYQQSHFGNSISNSSRFTDELSKLFLGYSSTLDRYLLSNKPETPEQKDPAGIDKDSFPSSQISQQLETTNAALKVSTCAGIGSEDSTNFVNPSYPLPDREKSLCSYRLYVLDPLVCQVKVTLMNTLLSAPTDGSCVDQVFSVDGTIEVPALNSYCGTNKDQHFYIQLLNASRTSSRWIDFSVNTHTNKRYYKYSIFVSQIRCVEEENLVAPRGCLQYFSDTFGFIKSFNFEDRIYYSNMNYNICIRKIPHGCQATFTAADGDFGIQKLHSRLTPLDSSGVGIHTCIRDYLDFQSSSSHGVTDVSKRLCGTKFSPIPGDQINRPVVSSPIGDLFVINVRSGTPFSFNNDTQGPGFKLSFVQRTNC